MSMRGTADERPCIPGRNIFVLEDTAIEMTEHMSILAAPPNAGRIRVEAAIAAKRDVLIVGAGLAERSPRWRWK